MRIRNLIDPHTNKTWNSRCEGSTAFISSGVEGKEKITEKIHADEKTAIAWAEKEEWTRLKKGFVLNNPQAKSGEPRMHYCRGRAYTGALPIFDVNGRMFCSSYDDATAKDKIFLINENAKFTALPELPENRLIWKGFYQADLKQILLLADHQILSINTDDQRLNNVTLPNKNPVSCLDLSGTIAVWYEEPELVVSDISQNKTLLRLPMKYQTYSGHTPQMSVKISSNANILACCVNSGEILLINIASGSVIDKLTGDFEMIAEMAFTIDDRYLIASEAYGKWKLMCFDLNTKAIRNDWLSINNLGSTEFSICKTTSRIAVANRSNIEIYNLIDLKQELSFPVEHHVKRFKLCWIGKWLGVQTDYGCASLYVTNQGAIY